MKNQLPDDEVCNSTTNNDIKSVDLNESVNSEAAVHRDENGAENIAVPVNETEGNNTVISENKSANEAQSAGECLLINEGEVKGENTGMKQKNSSNLVTGQNVFLLLACIILGILADYLFYGKRFGISYPLFVIVLYSVFIWRYHNITPFDFSFKWLLSIPVILLSATYCIFDNVVFKMLNFMGIPILVVAQTILIAHGNEYEWYENKFAIDILNGIFYRAFVHIMKPFQLLIKLGERKTGKGAYKPVINVLIALVIWVPLAMIIVPLLASADQVFGDLISNISRLLRNINIYNIIFRIFAVIFISSVFFSYIFSFTVNKADKSNNVTNDRISASKVWEPVITITVLTVVNLIYIIFIFIQFKYLFARVIPEGFSYSGYARKGFFELVAVTLINLAILIFDINLVKSTDSMLNKVVKVLQSLLIVCTSIMLVSAFYRMVLYEMEYGYTYLRIFTQAFMLFIFALLIATMIKVWNQQVRLLKAYIIIALISYTLINYANVDVMIAKANINAGKIDVDYLVQLSNDAVPQIEKLLDDGDEEIESKVRSNFEFRKKHLEKNKNWQSFNIARYRAWEIVSKY